MNCSITLHHPGGMQREALAGAADNWTLKLGAGKAVCSVGVRHWRSCRHCTAEAGMVGKLQVSLESDSGEGICVAGIGRKCRSLTREHIES